MPEIRVKGMNCPHCLASVSKALKAIDTISDIQVDLDSGRASYTGKADMAGIKAAISAIGFEVIDE